jgi:hypothetical protein
MGASYPYYNPSCRRIGPEKERVPKPLSHEQKGRDVTLEYRENGAKVVRADLIYTLNGNDRHEEWFRSPAELGARNTVTARLPEGATHFFFNLIDENNFLVSHPVVPDAVTIRRTGAKFAPSAIKTGLPADSHNLERTGKNGPDKGTSRR